MAVSGKFCVILGILPVFFNVREDGVLTTFQAWMLFTVAIANLLELYFKQAAMKTIKGPFLFMNIHAFFVSITGWILAIAFKVGNQL